MTAVEGFPRTFGAYLLLSSFGRGGMGEVFLAKKRALGDIDRLCIVKTLRGDLAEHGEYVRRFLDEARIVTQLTHSNVCQVYETGRVGADYFMAMEYISGVNLKDLALDLAQRGERMPTAVALSLGEQIGDALSYAHRLRSPVTGAPLHVVHRDVSPANVMVSFEGDVKLIDFGLAESALKTEQTETRLVMGKVAYMAPEQARGEDIDGTADQFALAVLVYEALAGDRFYGAMNTHQVWQVVGHGGFRPRRWNDLDPELAAILDRALAADAKRRFGSCDELRDALEDVRSRRFPRGGRGGLRELLTRLYADRLEAERDIIASFADLRAPLLDGVADGGLDDPGAPLLPGVSATTPRQVSMYKPAPATAPWRSSPSGSEEVQAERGAPLLPPGVATARVSRAPSPSLSATDVTERSTPAPVGPSATMVSSPADSLSASTPFVAPSNTPARLVVAAAAVVVVAAAAALAWPRAERGTAPAATDGGPAVVAVLPPPPGMLDPVAPVAPVARVEPVAPGPSPTPAPVSMAGGAEASTPAAGGASNDPTGRRKPGRRASNKVATGPAPAPAAMPSPTSLAPTLPRAETTPAESQGRMTPTTVPQMVGLLEKCSARPEGVCAVELLKLERGPQLLVAARRCAEKCLKLGVR